MWHQLRRVWKVPFFSAIGLMLALTASGRAPSPILGPRKTGGDDDLVAQGQQIYREGALPAGQPVAAVVQGDVPVDGTMFTCLNCHRRSGWGATEGDRIAIPVTRLALYQPRESGYRTRPAYTDESLAKAMREGIDSADRPLDLIMPLYRLSEPDMAALIAYLKNLSAEPPLGVTETTIHFATVLTEDVDPSLRQVMQDVLEDEPLSARSNWVVP